MRGLVTLARSTGYRWPDAGASAATVRSHRPRTHDPQSIGTDVIHNARTMSVAPTLANRPGTGVKQGLPTAVAVILNSDAAHAAFLGTFVGVTEPMAVLKR